MIVVVVMVVVIPVMVGAPAIGIGVPPAMAMVPAVVASLLKFTAPVLGLIAVAAVMFDGFVKVMIGFVDTLLAIVIGAGQQPRRGITQS